MSLLDKPIRIIYLIVFLLFSVTAIVWINHNYGQKKQRYYSKVIDELRTAYGVIISSNSDTAKIVFKSFVNRPEILEIFKRADSKNERTRDLVRRQLLTKLSPLYELLKLQGVRQFQFHLPNSESFLRFHRPEKYGDSLKGIRYSVDKANSQLVEVSGFEEGRINNGFRNVFPILYNSEHLGSVEVSMSFKSIHKRMETQFPNKYAFIIKSQVVDKTVFREEKVNYNKSDISDEYLYEKGYEADKNLRVINAKIKPKIHNKLKADHAFVVEEKVADAPRLIVFLPINSIQGEKTAYIVSYNEDATVSHYYVEYLVTVAVSIAGFFIIMLLFYLLTKSNRSFLDEKERFKAVVDSAEDVIFIKDRDDKYTLINPAFGRVFGLPKSELLGKTDEMLSRDQIAEIRDVDKRVFGGERFKGETTKAIKGKLHFFDVVKVPLTDSQGSIIGLCGISRDITARKQIEDELQESNKRLEETLKELEQAQEKMVQQERLAAVGQLAAGIAHDFNNILTGILGFSELLLLSPDTPESMRSKLQKIASSSQRAAFLVNQLLDFSRKSIRRLEKFDVGVFTKEFIKFLERTIPENIQISLNIAPGDYMIEGDATQIRQMITNLAVNARDAMPHGGKLKIGLSQIEGTGEEHCVGCGQVIAGKWIAITVTDTGQGMDPSILSHIFEPFFTTKEVGKGTGMGLSQVYGIVKQHGGHITSSSQAGKGATFTIYLPFLPRKKKEIIEKTASTLQGQGEKILLVEDDPIVMEISKELLEYLNYKVLTAVKGQDAIKIYQKNKNEIVLVLSDMIMPDMEGEQLFYTLKAQNPEIKMVMMSGYPLDKKGAELLEQGLVAWFEKPLSLEKLSTVVKKAVSDSKKKGRWE